MTKEKLNCLNCNGTGMISVPGKVWHSVVNITCVCCDGFGTIPNYEFIKEKENEKLKKENIEYRTKIRYLESNIKSLQYGIKQDKADVDRTQMLYKENNRYYGIINDLKKENEKYKKQINLWEIDIANLISDKIDLNKIIERDDHKIQELKKEKDQCYEIIECLQKEKFNLSLRINEIIEENKRYKERLQIGPGGSDEIDALEQSTQFLKHEIECLKKEISIVTDHSFLLNRQYILIQKENHLIKLENGRLQKKINISKKHY